MAIAIALTSSAAAQAINLNPVGVDPEHYLCYPPTQAVPFAQAVELDDQFRRDLKLSTIRVAFLCNPVQKDNQRLADRISHLVCYLLSTNSPVNQAVETDNQFATHRFTAGVARLLCVPSLKRER
jgi:hypothetical protein